MRDGDPPPYLCRMQQLGYPPGYLGDPDAPPVEDTPLRLYDASGDGQGAQPQQRGADGGVTLPLVDFPGLNVPPPPGANMAAWGWRGA